MSAHPLQEGTSPAAMPSQDTGVPAEASPAPPSASETRPTKIVIYQNVLTFLKDACSTWTLGRSRSEVARLQATVEGYLLSMTADSIISGIVASPAHRKILLELCSKLDLENDPRIRAALREDEERIAAFIVSILESESALAGVLRLEGDSAQCFLDVVQDALNRGFLMAREHSRQARRIVRKLAESCDKLPSSIFITVTGREDHPTFAGGFGDIYRASHNNLVVALKHMRQFQSSDPEIRDIRLKLCREALVWKDLRHPHILPFLGIDRDTFPSALCSISPWMEHGTILKYLQIHGRGNVDKLLHQVAQGLNYLHSCNIVHGDLRGANILINDDWSACLADFGLSVFSNATTSMHTTSTRAGSLYWMAPELIDPDRFGCKFARTKSSDIYAFGCVCVELYTGHPPFAELSQGAALLRIVNGERPRRPSGAPTMSDVPWKRVNAYWAHDPTARPVTAVVVQEMTWPPPQRPKSLRPLPAIPAPPPTSSSDRSSAPSSPPVYITPQGSPPGYDTADYQRVELTTLKWAEMEKARQQGPSRELDLAHIMTLVRKASGRALLDQTVVLTDGIQTLFEKARKREVTKLDQFATQLVGYSEAGRFHNQDAAFRRRGPETPEPPDPDEIITLPQFVQEAPPSNVLDDPVPIAPVKMPLKIPPRPHRPTLPWLRISPSITSLRVQLTSAKSSSSIPLPGSDADRKVASAGPKSAGPKSAGPKSAGPKTSAPRHRFRSASASATKPQTKPQIPRRSSGGLDSGIKNPRERVPVYYTPAVSTPSKTEALRELWRRVMPPVIDTEDARSNSSFSIGRPSEYDHEGIPASPLDNTFHTTTDELHATTGEPEVAGETETTPIKAEIAPVTDAPSLGSPQKRRSDPHTLHHIPPDEDMWRLFECKFGTRNAAQLSAALTMTPPQGLLNNLGLEELRKQCLESQQIIFAQISWASASAERSRVAKLKEQPESSLDALTWEEELHLEMLASNERLLAALRTYDDLRCAAVECETKHRRQATQDSISSVDTMRADGSSRQPPQVLSIDQPIAEDPPPSSQTKVKAVKDFVADPDDPDEVSFGVGDVLEILDKQGKWWLVQNAEGAVGIASSDHFRVLDGDARQPQSSRSSAGSMYPAGSSGTESSAFSQEEIFGIVDEELQSWKAEKGSSILSSDSCDAVFEPETLQYKAQALYSYTANADDPRELSFLQGEILDIGDKRSDWWPARSANGSVGIAPSNYLQLL